MLIATPGGAISMLKQDSKLKKKKTLQVKHEIDFSKFKQPPRLRVRRLEASPGHERALNRRAQDSIMEEEKKEEKFSEGDH